MKDLSSGIIKPSLFIIHCYDASLQMYIKSCGGSVIFVWNSIQILKADQLDTEKITLKHKISWYIDILTLFVCILIAGCFLVMAARGASRATLTAGDEEKQKFLLWLIFPFKDEKGQRKAARNCYIMRHQARDRQRNMRTRDERQMFLEF